MPDVFVSHATRDDAVVTEIHDALEKRSEAEIWVDHKDIGPGENWQTRIEQALKDCPYLLVIISRHSVASDEVTAEWRAALTYNHALLLLIIDDVPKEDIPARLRLHQWLDWNKDRDGALDKLAAAITGGAIPGASPDVIFSPSMPILTHQAIDQRLTKIPLQGRERELAATHEALNNGQIALLKGYGGRGKSRLAWEIVMTVADMGGAVWHVCDAEFSRASDVTDLLRDHFGLEPTAKEPEVLALLKTRRRLIVLDNAEAIPPADPRRADYVRLVKNLAYHGARVLLTSRAEWEELDDLNLVVIELFALEPAEARATVLEMGKFFGVTGLEPHADQIAEAARYHPRLIEWVVKPMTKFGIAKMIDDARQLRGVPVEKALDDMIHRIVSAMTTATDETAANVLRWLNVFNGTFTYDAATSVTIGAADDGHPILNGFDQALLTLQVYSLLSFDQATQRYTIDHLVREVLGTDPAAHAPHFAYFEQLHGDPYLNTDEDRHQDITADFENIRAALAWGLTAEPRRTCNIVVALDYYVMMRDSLATRRELLMAGLQAALDSAYDRGQAHTLRQLGNLSVNEAEWTAARDYYQRALSLYKALRDRLGQANTLLALGDLSLHEDELAAARRFYKRALPLYEALEDRLGQANTLLALGDVVLHKADWAVARDYYQQALTIYEAIEFRLGQANTLKALGDLSLYEADLAAGRDYYQRALPLYEALGDQLGQANTLKALGEWHQQQEQWNEALTEFYKSLMIYESIGNIYSQAITRGHLCITFAALGQIEESIQAMLFARSYFQKTGLPHYARWVERKSHIAWRNVNPDIFDDLWRKLTGDEPPEWLL